MRVVMATSPELGGSYPGHNRCHWVQSITDLICNEYIGTFLSLSLSLFLFSLSQVLQASETTSFEIVFLPRSLGLVVDTLHIHSSLGNFDYEVRIPGEKNPLFLLT